MNSIRTGFAGLAVLALAAIAALVIAAPALAGVDLSTLYSFDWTHAAATGFALANAPLALNIQEKIKAFEAQRQATQAKADAIVELWLKEDRSGDEREQEEHKGLIAEVEATDRHIGILKAHEQRLLAGTTVVVPRDAGQDGAGSGTVQRGAGAADVSGRGPIVVRSNLPPGLRFTRFALAMAQAKGNVMLAHEIAKTRYADTPDVVNCLKAAISMGGTQHLSIVNEHPLAVQKAAVTAVAGTDTAVVQYTDLQNEFVGLLRPKLIMGRMTQLNRVPFLSRLGRQLTGVTGSFVGEGAPKPVQKQTYDNVTLSYAKVAVIVVLNDEAVRFGTIDVEMRARDDMVRGIATYIDKRFMDPSYSGTANVSPASITNGATRVQSSGTTLAAIDADVRSMFAMFATSDVDPSTAVWVMSAGVALRLALKRNAYDEPAFPGMADAIATGRGTWYGLPVLVSNAMVTSGSPAEQQIALVTQEEVLLADDGNVSIDMSSEASVQMNDAPSAGAQSLVSLWQNNLLAVRAEQYINWAARRTSNLGIALLENTNY